MINSDIRDLDISAANNPTNTVEACSKFCFSSGYSYAGLQYGYLNFFSQTLDFEFKSPLKENNAFAETLMVHTARLLRKEEPAI